MPNATDRPWKCLGAYPVGMNQWTVEISTAAIGESPELRCDFRLFHKKASEHEALVRAEFVCEALNALHAAGITKPGELEALMRALDFQKRKFFLCAEVQDALDRLTTTDNGSGEPGESKT